MDVLNDLALIKLAASSLLMLDPNKKITTQGFATQACIDGTVTFTNASKLFQEFTGDTQYQIVNLGNATTYVAPYPYTVINSSNNIIIVTNSGGTVLRRMLPGEVTIFICVATGSANGTWAIDYRLRSGDMNKHSHWEDDFDINGVSGSSFAQAGSGTGAINTFGSTTGITASQNGLVELITGTTTTGRAALHRGNTNYFFSGGVHIFEIEIYLPALSNGTDEYSLRFGFGNNSAGGDMANGVYFEYDRTSSVNWRCKSALNNTRTTTTSSVAVAATTWTKLRLEVNAAGTRADFFVNDANVGNVQTNIPITSARVTGEVIKIEKSAGTTSVSMVVDWVTRDFIRTTAA